jgi:hypothetical protein
VATVAGAIVDALGQLADEPKCILVKKAQSGPEASLVSTIVSCGPHAVRIAVVTPFRAAFRLRQSRGDMEAPALNALGAGSLLLL